MNQQNTAPGPAVIPMPTRAPAAPSGPPTLTLSTIKGRLAAGGVELGISAAYLEAIGFKAAGRDRSAILFHEHQFHAICDALIAQVARAKLAQREAA